jgi:arylsulfatase
VGPELFRDRERLKLAPTRPDGSPLHSEVDLADHAIDFIAEQRATTPDRPFFLYLAFSAGHAPHQAPPEYLEKWRGQFERGWDAVREETLARQIALGLVPPGTTLPPRNPGVKAWADLPADERRLYARYYETFAAFVEHTDAQFGRLLDYLEGAGLRDNTLVIVASDNGASPEGGPEGMWNEVRLFTTESFDRADDGLKHLAEFGTPSAYPTYPIGWTMAGNTPFKRTKGTTHEGGTRVPLIMGWPARIKADATVRPQFHDVVDLLPTILEATGTSAPAVLDGRTQLPLAGTSMGYTWEQPAAPSRRTTQYIEIYGHRAIYHDGWKAVTSHAPGMPYAQEAWELYDLRQDLNELHDRAKAQPGKLAELLAVWEREARANDVYPLDDRRGARELLLPADSPARGRHFEFFPPVRGIHKGAAPDLRKRSWTLTADLGEGTAKPSGVIAAFGGRFAGWSLYVQDDRLIFHYNYAGIERAAVTSDLEVGRAKQVGVSFSLDRAGGADVALSIDGREVGRGRVPHVLLTISHETFDLGCDLATPVSEDYASPANFTGDLRRVVIDADPFQN